MSAQLDNSTLNSLIKAYCGAAGLEGHVEICDSSAQIGQFFIVASVLLFSDLFDYFLDLFWARVFAFLHSMNVGE
jgi:hypothetical protein